LSTLVREFVELLLEGPILRDLALKRCNCRWDLFCDEVVGLLLECGDLLLDRVGLFGEK
jgi:hypothetical protein